jgi:hypothetical protein
MTQKFLNTKDPKFGTPRNGGTWPSLRDASRDASRSTCELHDSFAFAALDPAGRCMATSTDVSTLLPYLNFGAHLAILHQGKAIIFTQQEQLTL